MSDRTFSHYPVLRSALMTALMPEQGGVFIDCTLGLGGHTASLLAANPEVKVLGIDRDSQALQQASLRLAEFGPRLQTVQADFRTIRESFRSSELASQPVKGILADLGVSSLQLDSAVRGFSFQQAGPLDMRMDQSQPQTAATLVNSLSESELADLIYQYGEEPASRYIARRIVKAREQQPIETTTELAALVAQAVATQRRIKHKRRVGKDRIHPATQTFQALRIAVNQELKGLTEFVNDAIELLAPEGRLAIISFHSLEDRLIKNAFRYQAGQCTCPAALPRCFCGATQRVTILTKKPLTADESEMAENARSRSAKLRICVKL